MQSLKIDREIELRLYEEKDAAELFALVMGNYEHLRQFLHWVKPDYSLESAREFIIQNQKAVGRKSEAYGIFYKNKLAGSIGFVNLRWDSRGAEIGYWIAKDLEGKG